MHLSGNPWPQVDFPEYPFEREHATRVVVYNDEGVVLFSQREWRPRQFNITCFSLDDQAAGVQKSVADALRKALALAEGQPQSTA